MHNEVQPASASAAVAETTPGDIGEVSLLEHAIISTMVYRDLFNYAVTVAEIHRYLHGVQCPESEVARALSGSRTLAKKVVGDGHYFVLAGREALLEIRKRRERISEELWPTAITKAERIASLPFVRMVAVTGSLAVTNADKGADIDFMVVTEGGRLWTTRLATRFLQMADRLLSDGTMCANYLLSDRALPLNDQGLYVAHELTQAVPVYGFDVYAALRESNSWTDRYLPNAQGAPRADRTAVPAHVRMRNVAEGLLRSPPGRYVERWERNYKLRKYNNTAFLLGRMTRFSEEATGHRRTVRRLIKDAFHDRMSAVLHPSARLRILFAQAYHLHLDPKLWKSMQPFPPLGSLYAAAVARELGHYVRVYDSMLSISNSEWLGALQVNAPDVVVLYEDNFNYLTKMCLSNMRDAAISMIASAKQSGATVLMCSSDSGDDPEVYLRAGVDYVLKGEGEHTLADLLQLLTDPTDPDPSQIAGIAFLDENGAVVETPQRPVIRHVDDLPMPAWDLIDLQRYEEIWRRQHGRTAINMVTTRGCPYHCNWCAKPIWGQRYNARSPENVVDEIKLLSGYTAVDYVWFMDDIFGLKPRWIQRFADALGEQGLSIRFKALSRPDLLLREGEVDALARAGCDVIWMGAESGSQKILDAMEKGTAVEDILDACAALRARGIRVGLFIQFGYPGEDRDDIRATISMIRAIVPDELGISVSYPLPGTPFHERVREQMGTTRHWTDSEDLAMLFRGPYRTSFYRMLHRYVHADLAMRRAWRSLRNASERRELDPRQKIRRAGLIGYAGLRALVSQLALGLLSRLPHDPTHELPVEMSPAAAAIPSKQPREQ